MCLYLTKYASIVEVVTWRSRRAIRITIRGDRHTEIVYTDIRDIIVQWSIRIVGVACIVFIVPRLLCTKGMSSATRVKSKRRPTTKRRGYSTLEVSGRMEGAVLFT